ncbi:MAG: four helix bundle protein [Bacteroidia bacterium]|nr:four helix bundle protein [Bacteroidia bacterium]
MKNNNYESLRAYRLAFDAAMRIYRLSRFFPAEEKYSLIDQIRRSSRSVCANIAEGYRKRLYLKLFILKLADSDGECSETQVWLDFAQECEFLSQEDHRSLSEQYLEIGKLLGYMMKNPGKYTQ